MTAASAPRTDPVAVYRLGGAEGLSARPVEVPSPDCDWTEPLLRENAIWFCQLRWLVVGVSLAVGLVSLWLGTARTLGLELRPVWPLTVAGTLTALNLLFVRLGRRAAGAPEVGSIRSVLWMQITADLLILTGVIHWLGPGLPAAPFMYLFHIILACIVFSPGQSLLVAGLAATFYSALVLAGEQGWLPASSVLMSGAPVPAGNRWMAHVVPLFAVWAVIWYLVSRLAATLRRRECELAQTNRQLRASIEERANHMLQTTHQLKAPFAAIHALTQLLLGGYSGVLPAPAAAVVAKISHRCAALSRQIQEMLQLANLRSHGQTAPPQRELDLGRLTAEVLGRVEPAARQRGIRLTPSLPPTPVWGVGDHLTMLVENLVVNAVNYSRDGGEVEVSCQRDAAASVRLTVRDHGIGIPREKLPRIFDDYYRTEEAVQHNRASTGLGLAIVRQVAAAHHLGIEVESAPGWGTRFTVTFPRTGNPTA